MLQVETDFEEQYANGKVEGWENNGQENELIPSQHTVIDLDYYTTVEELVDVGPEKLKEVMTCFMFICILKHYSSNYIFFYVIQALGALGLKVGGTPQQRAERLFLTKVRTLAYNLLFTRVLSYESGYFY